MGQEIGRYSGVLVDLILVINAPCSSDCEEKIYDVSGKHGIDHIHLRRDKSRFEEKR